MPVTSAPSLHGTRTPRHVPCGWSIAAGRRLRVAIAAPSNRATKTARANQRKNMRAFMDVIRELET